HHSLRKSSHSAQCHLNTGLLAYWLTGLLTYWLTGLLIPRALPLPKPILPSRSSAHRRAAGGVGRRAGARRTHRHSPFRRAGLPPHARAGRPLAPRARGALANPLARIPGTARGSGPFRQLATVPAGGRH